MNKIHVVDCDVNHVWLELTLAKQENPTLFRLTVGQFDRLWLELARKESAL